MPSRLINWALKQQLDDFKGSATEKHVGKHVLLVLAIRADKATMKCGSSLTDITDDTGLNRTTVTRCVAQLEELAYIDREHNGTKGNVYTLLLGAPRNQSLVAPRAECATPLVAPRNQSDERKESNQRKESTNSIPITIHNSNPVVRRPTQVPDDFSVSETMRQNAHAEGFDDETIRHETAKMIDYFRGTGGTKKDWVAVWRNWLRNSLRFNGNGRRQTTKVDRTIENSRRFLSRLHQQDRGGGERGAERSDDCDLHGTPRLSFDGADEPSHEPHD